MQVKDKFMVLLVLLFAAFQLHSTPLLEEANKKKSINLIRHYDELLGEEFLSNAPGVSVLITKKGEVIYRKAFGLANLELNVALTPESVFRIGSITKQFTAVAILKLVEEGKLSLQDDISSFIPDFPTYGLSITVEHLLTHTSGIKSYTTMQEWTEQVRRKDFTVEQLIDFFKNQPMDFDPGERFRYNNSGYILLGYIIERVSGMTYQKYLQKNIFEPLGLNNTFYGSSSRIILNRASGYGFEDGSVSNAQYISMTQPYAAGALLSTVDDLFLWYSSLMKGDVLSQETLQRAMTSYMLNNGEKTSYGYGWVISALNGSETIEHGGAINGFLSQSIYLPKEDVFVCVLSNSTEIHVSHVATQLAALAIEKPCDYKVVSMSSEKLKEYEGVYRFNVDEARVVIMEEGRLYSQRSGGRKLRLFPMGDDSFFFENSFSQLHFLRSDDGKIYSHQFIGRSGIRQAMRSNEPIPRRKEVNVPVDVLKELLGVYQIMPQFAITITLNEGHLMAQGTGQQAMEIFAESQTLFFSKGVDAQFEFQKDDNGRATLLILRQGGRTFEGERK